jgi:tetratricopeptide (TPR) repeat protein
LDFKKFIHLRIHFVKELAIMSRPIKYISVLSINIILIIILSCSTGYDKHADKYYEEGLLFYERMEYDRSAESFNKVLELAPYGKDNNIVYFNRGMAYFKNRQYDKSIYDFTKALEMTPEIDKNLIFDILMFRGNAYQKSKEYEHAINDYSDAMQLIPEHNNIKFICSNRAWIWYAKGDYDNAIDDFSKAITIDPQFDSAFHGRASAWLKKEDLQRALVDAKEAVKLRPTNKEYDDLLYEIKSSMNEE